MHSIEREEADQEGIGLCGAPHNTLVKECALSIVNDAQHLDASESPVHVIIGLVPLLLEIDERTCSPGEFILGRLTVQSGNQLGGHAAFGELLGDGSHRPVIESAREAIAEGYTIRASHQSARSVVNQEVKERIVGSGYGTPKARLLGAPGLLLSEKPSLGQEIFGEGHAVTSVSSTPRTRT